MRSLYPKALVVATALLLGARVSAHSHTDLDGRLVVTGHRVDLVLRLTLHAMRHLVDVDRDGDGRMSPDEVASSARDLEVYLSKALRIETAGGEPCPLELADLKLLDFSSVAAHLRGTCRGATEQLTIESGLFAGTHHSYTLRLRATSQGRRARAVLSHRHNRATIDFTGRSANTSWPFLVAGAVALVLVVAGVLVGVRYARLANRDSASR